MLMMSYYIPNIGLPAISVLGASVFLIGIGYLALKDIRELWALISKNKIFHFFLVCLVLLLLYFVYSVSIRTVDLKGFAGLLIGWSIGLATFLLLMMRVELKRVIVFLSYIHVSAWALQVVYFFAIGQWLDFVSFFTDHRSSFQYYGGSFIIARFGGLYDEPALFGMVSFFLLTLRMIARNFRWSWIDFSLAVTGIASFSLSAMAFVIYLILLSCFIRKVLRKSLVFFFTILVALVYFKPLSWTPLIYLNQRIANFSNDPSFNERIYQGLDIFLSHTKSIILFGVGIGNYSLVEAVGNGYSFILIYFGVLGILLFFFGFLYLFKSIRVPTVSVSLVLMVLVGAPMYTKPFFWVWVTLVLFLPVISAEARKNLDRTQGI